MASIAALLKGGSFTPLPGGGFSFTLDAPKSKFKWDEKRFVRLYGKARAESLRKVGLIVKDRTQRTMSNRAPRQRPVQIRVGSRFGFDLVALVDRVPKSDVVTSWKTKRHPDGFLKRDIQSNFDMRSKTVVIGPAKLPALNQLQEKGGSARRWFKPIPKRARGAKIYGILTNTIPREGQPGRRRRGPPRRVMSGAYSFTIRIKPRAYMGKGLAKARPRIPEQFRDQIRGP